MVPVMPVTKDTSVGIRCELIGLSSHPSTTHDDRSNRNDRVSRFNSPMYMKRSAFDCSIIHDTSDHTNRRCNTRTYLKELGIAFPEAEWEGVTRYRRLRNSIMHKDGVLPDNDPVAVYGKKKGIVSEDELTPSVELTREFCEEALTSYERFFLKLHRAYQQWFQSNV